MKRRCPAPLAVLSLTALLLSAPRPTPALADTSTSTDIFPVVSDGTATYFLTTTAAIPAADPTSTGPQVVLDIQPPGTVLPTTNADGTQGSPLTVLPDSTGLDASKLVVGLKDAASGQPADQQLGLGFYGSGFQQGGMLHFSLNVQDPKDAPILVPETAGIVPGPESIQVPASTGSSSGGNPPPTSTPTTPTPTTDVSNTPEPMSIVVWSALAGLGLLRARAASGRRPERPRGTTDVPLAGGGRSDMMEPRRSPSSRDGDRPRPVLSTRPESGRAAPWKSFSKRPRSRNGSASSAARSRPTTRASR